MMPSARSSSQRSEVSEQARYDFCMFVTIILSVGYAAGIATGWYCRRRISDSTTTTTTMTISSSTAAGSTATSTTCCQSSQKSVVPAKVFICPNYGDKHHLTKNCQGISKTDKVKEYELCKHCEKKGA